MIYSDIDFTNILIFSGIFLLLFVIAEAAYHLLKIDVGYTRKFVHIMTGVIVMYFPIYFKKPIDLLIICISFFLILTLSKRVGLLKSINAIKRKSSGSTLYPLVVIICYLIQYRQGSYIYFFVPILILALADPMAEFAGKKFQYKPYSIFKNSKTVSGSIGFMLVAFLTGLIGLYYFADVSIVIMISCAFLIALFTTLGEAVSIKGFDNLVIPLCATGVLFIFGI